MSGRQTQPTQGVGSQDLDLGQFSPPIHTSASNQVHDRFGLGPILLDFDVAFRGVKYATTENSKMAVLANFDSVYYRMEVKERQTSLALSSQRSDVYVNSILMHINDLRDQMQKARTTGDATVGFPPTQDHFEATFPALTAHTVESAIVEKANVENLVYALAANDLDKEVLEYMDRIRQKARSTLCSPARDGEDGECPRTETS